MTVYAVYNTTTSYVGAIWHDVLLTDASGALAATPCDFSVSANCSAAELNTLTRAAIVDFVNKGGYGVTIADADVRLNSVWS
jgi:hypothetical protein